MAEAVGRNFHSIGVVAVAFSLPVTFAVAGLATTAAWVRAAPPMMHASILPPLNRGETALFRHCWRSGDWYPIEVAFGIRMPQYKLLGSTPEDELAELVGLARVWIETLVELSVRRNAPRARSNQQ